MVRSPIKLLLKAKELGSEYAEVHKNVKKRIASSEGSARVAEYAKIRHRSRIKSKTILYESFWGRGISDNPYAIFRYLLDNPAYAGYTHVWCVADFEDCASVIAQYSNRKSVRFVQVHSNEYLKALCTAKYLINNVTFPAYFTKRDGQVYINTWHGTPLKSMGYEQVGGNLEVANTIRNFLQADYLISANEVMTRMYMDSYKLRGILPGEVLETGYPRNDLLASTERSEISNKLAEYGIKLEEGKRVILYAPTWRQGTHSKAVVNGEELLAVKDALEKRLGTDSYQVLIKPHQYVYNVLKEDESYRGLLVPSTLDCNEVLSVVDILISDYSSIFLDYMTLNRPMVFYITDNENYTDGRGLAYTLDELPGPHTSNLEELANMISNIDDITNRYHEQYGSIRATIAAHEDGQSTARVVEHVFEGRPANFPAFRADHNKKRLLISVGTMLENGIVHSFLSLLNAIDYDEWDVTAYVKANGRDSEMRRKVIEDINPHVRTLSRVGAETSTLGEQARRQFVEKHRLNRRFWRWIYPDAAMSLEAKRAFGDVEFDYVVDFCGYNRFYLAMLLFVNAKKRSVWLHNDLKADMNKKVLGEKPNFEMLRFDISLYPFLDNLVSCGKSVMEVNRKKLSTPETYDKFTYAKNTLNAARLYKCEQENDVFTHDGHEYLVVSPMSRLSNCCTISYIELPSTDAIDFVTMGRFSTEKNHLRLIEAFAMLSEEVPQARLYIIGGGPLEDDTRAKVKKLNLEGKVILTGKIQNPYAIMRRCNCFILPSLHEGQPMVLLEARACGLPIIVSNFSSVKDSLIPDGQLVIEPTTEGILEGMRAFIRGEVPVAEFDIDQYNREAYEEFAAAIM